MNARDSAIVCSIALQCGADLETISKALCRDSHGRASGPLGTALDLLTDGTWIVSAADIARHREQLVVHQTAEVRYDG
jgi:hypothetical protein